jgi:hypothetical protein
MRGRSVIMGKIISAEAVLHGMQLDFDIWINRYEYKSGAFKGLINTSTPLVQTLDLLLASGEVTEDEKIKAFRPWKSALIRYYNKEMTTMNEIEMEELSGNWSEWSKVLEVDLNSRGGNLPPSEFELRNRDGDGGCAPLPPSGRKRQDLAPPKKFGAGEARHWEEMREKMKKRTSKTAPEIECRTSNHKKWQS